MDIVIVQLIIQGLSSNTLKPSLKEEAKIRKFSTSVAILINKINDNNVEIQANEEELTQDNKLCDLKKIKLTFELNAKLIEASLIMCLCNPEKLFEFTVTEKNITGIAGKSKTTLIKKLSHLN